MSPAEPERIELRPAVELLAVVALVSLLLVSWLVWTTTVHPRSSQTESALLHGTWRWVFAGASSSLAILGWAAVMWTMYCDVKTTVTGEGIHRPSLGGSRMLRWRDVKRIRSFGIFGIRFESSDERMTLWYSSYRDPGHVDSAVRALVRTKMASGEITLVE